MEEPHTTNPADLKDVGSLHLSGDSSPPLSVKPSVEQGNGEPYRMDVANPSSNDVASRELSATAEVKKDKNVLSGGTTITEQAQDLQDRGDVAKSPVDPNGDDNVVSTSKGLAELDLGATADTQFTQLDGTSGYQQEPFPPLHEPDPDFSTYFDNTQRDDGPPKIRAFAKIEFEDGQYYINTYAVELGRDVRAAKRAQQRRFQREVTRRDRRRRGSDSSDNLVRQGHLGYPPSSAVSESGGIVNFESLERRPRKKSKGKKSTSPSSSSFGRSRNNSIAEITAPFDYQALAYEQLLRSGPGAADDPASYVPSLDDVPLIPVHPPNDEDQPGAGYSGISRRHARIAYNFDINCFEFETLGRNGGFVDEIWLGPGEVATLDHGSKIQIGGVMMIFLLPNRGYTGTENTAASEAVSAMSFEFEDGRGESMPIIDTSRSASSEELPADQALISSSSASDGDDENAHLASGEESEDSDNIQQSIEDDEADGERRAVNRTRSQKHKTTKPGSKKTPKIKLKLKAQRQGKEGIGEKSANPKSKPEPPQEPGKPHKPEHSTLEDIANKLGVSVDELPTRKKGPGRPPKDGIMSKREYAQLVRQQKERQRAEGLQNGTSKPAKPSNGADGTALPEKRKYTKRKKPDEGDDPNGTRELIDGGEDGEGETLQAPKPVKEKRPQKPPRSPSPVIDESTLTEEQLAKPTQSYVVLIHEALSNSAAGQMSLPQIYRAIERRYPYYRFKVQTQGWQSSVRHNLSQHAAFRKIEKDGKGWMWGLVPEVSIEKEKKRRPSPPPTSQQTFYPPGANQPYRQAQYTYAPGAPSAPSLQTSAQFAHPYQAPVQGYSSTIPDVARTYGGSLIPGQGAGPSTYMSPYTPAPSAPVQAQSANSFVGSTPAPHNHVTSNSHYAATPQSAPATTSSSAPQTATSTQYEASGNASTTFSTTRSDVPQAMLDACVNFKSKLLEHVGNSVDIVQTIDRALNRALTSVMNGEETPPATEDRNENIFVTEAHKALRGIWIWATQSATTQSQPQSTMNATTSTPSGEANPTSASESTPATAISPSAPELKNEESVKASQASDAGKAPATPLEQHQQTPIQNLLQQLHPNSDVASDSHVAKSTGDTTDQVVEEGVPVPTQRSEVLTASRDAAKKAITALNVSAKRGHDEEENEGEATATNEIGHNLRRPSKRVAV